MKRFIALLAMAALIAGCATMYPTPTAPLCDKPEAAGSVLCAIGAKIGTAPEQMDTLLLDASLIGIATKVTTGDELRNAIGKVQKYVTDTPTLSINLIIGYLVKEAKIDPALALLLSRRLVFLQVPVLDIQTLTPFDVALVKVHLEHQMEQLDIF